MSDSQHYDLITGDKHLGRLYVFPVEEPELLAKGITKQWFVTHQEAGAIISGHVNEANQWSVSPPLSLEPTFDYQEKNLLFESVFEPKFTQQLKEQQQQIVGSSQQRGDSESGDSEGSEANQAKELDLSTILPQRVNNVVLPPIHQDIFEEEPMPISTDEPSNNETTVVDNLKELESSRKQLEETLALLLVEANLELEKDEDLNSLWLVEQDLTSGIKYLLSREDNHVVLAVNATGEIIESLSLNDAKSASKIISENQQEIDDDNLLPPVNKSKPSLQTIPEIEII